MKLSLQQTFLFYLHGFQNMKIGKTLWKIIFIKLVIILIFLKYFIYDKSIKTEFTTDNQRAEFVYSNLTISSNR